MTPRHTLARPVAIAGIALHAGTAVSMRLLPAACGAGIVFRRTDLGVDIPARYDLVGETRLGTVLEKNGARVGVVEHLLAACAGNEIDDLVVELDGPEPPILDGDSLSYWPLVQERVAQDAPRTAIKVLKPVTVTQGDATATLLPADRLSFFYALDYAVIGRQQMDFTFSRDGFRDLIAPARTFGFLKELEGLHKMKLALGASLDNTLALDDSGVVNKDRQRFPDEFARHKVLDAIGDMSLAGAPLIARFEGRKSGHGTNNALLRVLFADASQFERVELGG
jgi:UDP-3-O-[3-hydroxymyristoyl] N-acetylglucosamine deacetylase